MSLYLLIPTNTPDLHTTRIKTLKGQAYGTRDQEYFKLRLYHLHTHMWANQLLASRAIR